MTTRACNVCTSSRKTTIENAIRRGTSPAKIANTYGVARKTIRVHGEKHMGAAKAAPPDPISSTPTPAAAATPLDKARANAESALAALQKSEREALPLVDVTRLRGAYSRALELEAKLSRLTPETILKSEAWGDLLKQIVSALEKHPEAVRALHDRFAR